jgi:hypothetical protein
MISNVALADWRCQPLRLLISTLEAARGLHNGSCSTGGCLAGVAVTLEDDGVFSGFTLGAAKGVSVVEALFPLVDAGVLKLIREAAAGVDSLESLTDARVGAEGVSFALSLGSLTEIRTGPIGLSLRVLVVAASLFIGFAELLKLRAEGKHVIRDSLKIGVGKGMLKSLASTNLSVECRRSIVTKDVMYLGMARFMEPANCSYG